MNDKIIKVSSSMSYNIGLNAGSTDYFEKGFDNLEEFALWVSIGHRLYRGSATIPVPLKIQRKWRDMTVSTSSVEIMRKVFFLIKNSHKLREARGSVPCTGNGGRGYRYPTVEDGEKKAKAVLSWVKKNI
ncbi:MAG: hypothetical protein DRO11_10180 [Methanobacteriota archaeon]|nr:MAG: hypothetical protein DRO11_10180 [Euryarchaeota archaeon]